MTKLLIFPVLVSALILLGLIALAKKSNAAPTLGIKNDKLLDCPDSPNCVSTENFTIAPIDIKQVNAADAWQQLQAIITESGGQIQLVEESYLHATFTTEWLRFIDDLEARLDEKKGLIHLRSASRVGYYDFSVNRSRLLSLKNKINIFLIREGLNIKINNG